MSNINYSYVRPQKASALMSLHNEPFILKKLNIWSGQNATILPVVKLNPNEATGKGGVIDRNHDFVTLSATPPFVSDGYDISSSKYSDRRVVYCGCFVFHWGHFLVDVIPRLWYFLQNDTSVDSYVFAIEQGSNKEVSGNYREFLELLGIWDKLEFINEATTYKSVIVPERSFDRRKFYGQEYLDIFNTVANRISIQPSWVAAEKIYFSRSRLPKNKHYEIGTHVLDNFYKRNGYLVLYPETIPLSLMIFYIRNAKIIAAMSGTLPHNMLFAQSGQNLVIHERCVINNDWQPSINRLMNLNVTYIDSNLPVYTISMYGPFILGYNELLHQYALDNHLLPPSRKYISERYRRDCFAQYMRSYIDTYQFRWCMFDWYIPLTGYLLEGYQSGERYFSNYLTRRKPFFWYHYFQLHYIKQLIKHFIGRE